MGRELRPAVSQSFLGVPRDDKVGLKAHAWSSYERAFAANDTHKLDSRRTASPADARLC
jgi:hypothetical protein